MQRNDSNSTHSLSYVARRRAMCVATLCVAMAIALTTTNPPALGCEGCEALPGTYSDDIAQSTVTVIARAVKPGGGAVGAGLQKTKFMVEAILKGKLETKTIEAFTLPGQIPDGPVVLFTFADEAPFQWTAPLELTPLAVKYLRSLETVPEKGKERLKFFLPYVVVDDTHVANDAYNEFARTPFAEVKELGESLNRDWVIKHLTGAIASDDVPAYRIRLLWTFLAAAGEPRDAEFFKILANDESIDRPSIGFDNALACYMALLGEEGLRYAEQKFLSSSERRDTITGVNAVRFHAVETDTFTKARLGKALQRVLSRPEFAALVIPDLARIQDWTASEQMLSLFRGDTTGKLRVHIVNYFRTCPLESAKAMLTECEAIDASAIVRSRTLFPGLEPEDAATQNASEGGASAP